MRKKEKNIIFKINTFSPRNFISFFNLIVLTSTILFLVAGGVYAYLYTPHFEATGIVKSQPYAQINDISSNTLRDKKDTAPKTLQEMDLINTHSVFRRTIDKLHLNAEMHYSSWSPWSRLVHFFKTDSAWKQYLENGINDFSSPTGRLIDFAALDLPQKLWGKSIKVQVQDGSQFTLQLPNGQKIQCKMQQPCIHQELGTGWTIRHIYVPSGHKVVIDVHNPDQIATELRTQVNVTVPNEDNKHGDQRSALYQDLIQLSLVEQNPILARAIVNDLLDSAVYFARLRKEKESHQAAQLLQEQEVIINERLIQTNTELAELKNRHQPLNPEIEAQYLYKKLGFIQETMLTLQQKEQDLKLRMTLANPQLRNVREEMRLLHQEENQVNAFIKKMPLSVKRIQVLEGELLAQLDVLKNVIAQKQLLQSLSKAGFSDLQIVEQASIPVTSIDYSRLELMLMLAFVGLILGYIIATAIV